MTLSALTSAPITIQEVVGGLEEKFGRGFGGAAGLAGCGLRIRLVVPTTGMGDVRRAKSRFSRPLIFGVFNSIDPIRSLGLSGGRDGLQRVERESATDCSLPRIGMGPSARAVTPAGRGTMRSSNAAETSTRQLASRHASRVRCVVFMASPISAISFLTKPSSPTTTGPQCRPARKSARKPKSRS